jgi:putative addiction module component (TIGR02574 family)
MTNETIKKQALELSDQERAELAHILIKSLHQESEYNSEDEWSNELNERITCYERSESTSKPWSEIKKNARSLLLNM